MRNNNHIDFLKRIRIQETKAKKMDGNGEICSSVATEQEELDLQRELERRFEELFGPVED